jgi:O-antigen/teichoic acid export membrane protein
MARPAAGRGVLPDSSHDAHRIQQRGTQQLLLARACFFASSYVVAAILARKLGPAEYGIYGVIVSQLLWVEIVVNAGVPGATSKLIADRRHDVSAVEASSRALVLGLSCVLLAVCWIAAPFAARVMQFPEGTMLLRIAALDLPFAALYAAYDGILSGRRRFGLLALALVTSGFAKLAGILVLVQVGLSVGRVLAVTVLSSMTVLVVLSIGHRFNGRGPRLATLRELALLAAPMGAYLIAGQVLVNVDLWLLKALWTGDPGIVGQYVASLNLARLLAIIPAVQAGVLFASVAWAVTSRDLPRARGHIQHATRFALILSTAALVILGLNGSEVLGVLFSSAYSPGQRFLWFQLTAFGLFALLDAWAHALMAAGRQWMVALALLTVVPIVSGACFVFIPSLGPIGGVMALLLGVAAATAVVGTLVFRQFGALVPPVTLVRVTAAAAAVGLTSMVVRVSSAAVLLKIAVLSAMYLAILHALGEITASDFKFVDGKPGTPATTPGEPSIL